MNSFFVRSWVKERVGGVRALTMPRLQPSGVDALEGCNLSVVRGGHRSWLGRGWRSAAV